MARHIHSRLKITGELVSGTPLHVGGYGESFETDMAIACNGRGEFYIPGTSMTGSLRSWFEQNFPDEANDLWGFQTGDRGHASFVTVEDLSLPEHVQSELRDGVGIHRFYGTAADRAKFDRAILPKGTRLNFEMTVDLPSRKLKPKEKQNNETDKYNETVDEFKSRIATTKAMFLLLIEALQNETIRLGASKTRGFGKVKLSGTEIKEDSLETPDILNVLEEKRENWLALDEFQGEFLKDANAKKVYDGLRDKLSTQLLITIKWNPKSTLMVKAGYEGIGVDMLPLTSGTGKDKVSLVLPGSSIKGALRSQAERILRTVLEIEAPRDDKNSQNFSNQLRMFNKDSKETKATKLIGALFGAKREKEESNQSKSTLGLGALSIDDCYFGKQMNVADWQAVETAKTTKTINSKEEDITYTEQELWQALTKIDGNTDLVSPTRDFTIAHHVAIDRWTGGASEGALYSLLQPTVGMGWQDICLMLDMSRLRKADGSPDESLQKRCWMLLLLVLRDFAENRLPLGFATNRGLGEVKDVSFETKGIYEVKWRDGRFEFRDPADLKGDLEKEWKEWLKNN